MNNTIEIKGETFKYEVQYFCGNFYEYYFTIFYKDEIKRSRKRFVFFGKKIVYYKPIVLFTVYCDITNSRYTKIKMKKIIEDAYNKYVGLLNRENEIKNNEII